MTATALGAIVGLAIRATLTDAQRAARVPVALTARGIMAVGAAVGSEAVRSR